ncbi:MAG: hypothetical protein ABI861_01665 [Panacibacter sp.]
MKTLRMGFILLACTLTSCIGAGTLGGFDIRIFHTSKQNLVRAVDTLFAKYPEYQIPDKWKSFDDWKERGYDFLDSRIFYFKSEPEEMYYVTFLGAVNDSVQVNNTSTSISIRAIDNGTSHWTLEEETNSPEKKRIENRFDQEIISKLEQYTNTKSTRE